MQEQVIICPKCGHEIPSETISLQMKEGLRKELEREYSEKADEQRKRIESEAKRKAEDSIGVELKDLREQIKEKDVKLKDLAEAELKLRKQWRELDEKKSAFELKMEKEREDLRKEFDEQFAEKMKVAETHARQTAEKKYTTELQDLQERIKEAQEEAQEAKKKELDLRKRERELEKKQKETELEIARKVDEEKRKAIDEVVKAIEEQHRLKDLEKQKQLNDMKKQIEDLKRKAEQGSQQTQGEILELELEDLLRANFPEDEIKPVPKGIRGADLLQNVCEAGRYCGTIVWEAKRTKAWQKKWVEKLKDDQRKVKAEIAVLLSTVLPKEKHGFFFEHGIWVTDYSSAVGLACALRINLINVARARQASVGRDKKMEIMYDYLSGPEFKQKVETLADAFTAMIEDLEQEKRAMARIWAKREKQIRKVVVNTAGMYGDMQGIIGASMPQIEKLELKALSEGED